MYLLVDTSTKQVIPWIPLPIVVLVYRVLCTLPQAAIVDPVDPDSVAAAVANEVVVVVVEVLVVFKLYRGRPF